MRCVRGGGEGGVCVFRKRRRRESDGGGDVRWWEGRLGAWVRGRREQRGYCCKHLDGIKDES
jgi:hypothetical protein